MAIVLDPDGIDGAPEVAYLLDVTSGAGVTGSSGLGRGKEGTTARAHVAGTPWVHAPTLRDVVRVVSASYGGGDFTFSNTSFADLRTDIDLVIPAFVGDVLEVEADFVNNLNNANSYIYFDAQTRVSGTGVNAISGGLTSGVPSWTSRTGGTQNEPVTCSGSWLYTAVSGDIASNTVTLRLRTKVSLGTGQVLANGTATLLQWHVKNLGPATAIT